MADVLPSSVLPADTASPALAELPPEPLRTAAELKQAADCETLRAAREASHSESDRIAYALDMVLITHPGCCTPKKPGGQS
ncbi:hypothetical protein [Streptomyces sp. NPDC086989]|uniref:hypothetical protein n=1 Tax=Streptomyces sp. NPDC086989 TaxID=3365764 RepID=UPI0037F42A48